jgi:hypothetical protein
MHLRPVGVPPSDLKFGRESRIAAEPAGPVGHSKEPCHVAPGGFWIIVWKRSPGLASTQDVPSRLQISEWSQRKPVPHHAEQSRQHSQPVAAVVPNPRLTLAATNRNWIECEPVPLPSHGPIFPHRIVRGKTETMHAGPARQPASTIDEVVEQLQQRIDALPRSQVHRRTFMTTYQRTTQAVGDAVDVAFFEDPDWVVSWDVAFADLFIVAHDADQAGARVPRPWRLAFQADPTLPTIVHLLLGMNAHINYDLPQATLSVITDQDFEDPVLIDSHRRDHERIDKILARRVTAEDHAIDGARSALDRILTPANRLSSRRFLREARNKVWLNVAELQRARLAGSDAYHDRLAELEVLAAAKIADLSRPGQVLLRLAMTGFGVTLPPP